MATVAVPDLEALSAQDVLAHMVEHHHPRLALACSFQKEEAVLIDMLMAIEPSARVFTIDTGVLFPETYAAWRELESVVKDLSMPVDFSLETMNEFIDWSRSSPFKVERGEGECAV